MKKVTFQDLDDDLAKKISQKSSKIFAIAIAVFSGLFLPIFVSIFNEFFMQREKSRIDLSYDIEAYRLRDNDYTYSFLIKNKGRRDSGEGGIVFRLDFEGEIDALIWARDEVAITCPNGDIPLDDFQCSGGIGENIFEMRFKHLAVDAEIEIKIRAKGKLKEFPLLSYGGNDYCYDKIRDDKPFVADKSRCAI